MEGEEISSITERSKGMVTIMGYNHNFPKTTYGFLDFITTPHHKRYSFTMVSRCEGTIELSEKTARAFALEILRRCDTVKKEK